MSPAPQDTDKAKRMSPRRVAIASFIGTAIEWYDFYLYGTAAALVFNHLFFPDFSPLAGTLLALSTFSAGFIARPLGGIVMGHFGDRIGRKSMLVLSLLMMGFATALIGVLPTYATAGIWAPVLLVLLRVVQGFGVGGEWGGAVLMAVEHAPARSRGFFGAWPQMGVPAGLLLANGVFMGMTTMLSTEAFQAWGWRIPFLASAALVIVGLFIRLRIEESPDFQEISDKGQVDRFPVLTLLRQQWRVVLLAAGVKLSQNSIFYILTVFVLTYATTVLGLDQSVALIGVVLSSALSLVNLLFFGWLSDRYGRRLVYLVGVVASLLFSFPFFWLLDTRSAWVIWLAMVIGMIAHDMMYGPQAAYFSELFDANVRYSGASLGYQLSSVVAGGLSPVIAVALLGLANNHHWPIAVYMMGVGVISVLATCLGPETHRGDRRTAAGPAASKMTSKV
ncbi:metabolite-proton symporter [Tamaricihabitans halophyticus]|uniref:Putative proline/betaine transporter n=1 Tax=Tamaricihabitans halophyticus TaxID=1262583 RepID=A0A4R2R7G1_9PSEU|nr:MFS transporter [Tamaricihabitans halophyticus]TCP55335.1 metabolite-proton symporter [Tamaricihabitans halophyticus]